MTRPGQPYARQPLTQKPGCLTAEHLRVGISEPKAAVLIAAPMARRKLNTDSPTATAELLAELAACNESGSRTDRLVWQAPRAPVHGHLRKK